MDSDTIKYYWQRLLVSRARDMSEGQRKALGDDILGQSPPDSLGRAAQALMDGNLNDKMVVDGYRAVGAQSLNVQDYRESKAVTVEESSIESRMDALLRVAHRE